MFSIELTIIWRTKIIIYNILTFMFQYWKSEATNEMTEVGWIKDENKGEMYKDKLRQGDVMRLLNVKRVI